MLAFHDVNPQAPVHVLIIPKRGIPRLAQATSDDQSLLGKLLLTSRIVAEKLDLSKSGYRVVINSGPDAGESVPHLHIHVLGKRALAWPPGCRSLSRLTPGGEPPHPEAQTERNDRKQNARPHRQRMPADNHFRFCYESPDVNQREKPEDRPRDSQCCVLGIHICFLTRTRSEFNAFCNDALLLHDNRRFFIGGVEEMFRHLCGHADAAMRSAKAWDVAGMHPVSASEAQKIRHFCSLKFRALGLWILGRVNVPFHDLAIFVDVVTVRFET